MAQHEVGLNFYFRIHILLVFDCFDKQVLLFLNELKLKDLKIRTVISGPEFLNYTHKLTVNIRPKTAAF